MGSFHVTPESKWRRNPATEWTVKETTPVAGFDFALWYKIVRLFWTVTAFVIACCTVIAAVTLHSNFQGVIITPLMGLI